MFHQKLLQNVTLFQWKTLIKLEEENFEMFHWERLSKGTPTLALQSNALINIVQETVRRPDQSSPTWSWFGIVAGVKLVLAAQANTDFKGTRGPMYHSASFDKAKGRQWEAGIRSSEAASKAREGKTVQWNVFHQRARAVSAKRMASTTSIWRGSQSPWYFFYGGPTLSSRITRRLLLHEAESPVGRMDSHCSSQNMSSCWPV